MAGDVQEILRTNSRGEQRLVCVPEGGVRDSDPRLLPQLGRELFRAEFLQQLACPVWHGPGQWRQLADRILVRRRRPVGLVDGHVREISEQPGAPIRTRSSGEQVRVTFDEAGGEPSGTKVRVMENRLEGRDVGGYPTDPELRTARRARSTAAPKVLPRHVNLVSSESEWALISAPV